MDSSDHKQVQLLMVPKILCSSLIFSTLLFLYILYGTSGMNTNFVSPFPLILDKTPLFLVIAIMPAILAIVLPRQMSRKMLEKLAGEQFQELRPQHIQIILTPLILRFALAESVCLFGFLAATQTLEMSAALPFYLVTWPLMAMSFPTKFRVQSWISRGQMF